VAAPGTDGGQDVEAGESGNADAGPSDYWRRTPSPPTDWRQASTEARPEEVEQGNYDEWRPQDTWRPHDSPGLGPFTPPFKMVRTGDGEAASDAHSGGVDQGAGAIGTPDVIDEGAYQKRMMDVFQAGTPDSPRSRHALAEPDIGSPTPSVLRGLGARTKVGERGQSVYEAAYREALGERDSEKGGIGEEEFGTLEFPQRVSVATGNCSFHPTYEQDDTSDATLSSVSASVTSRPPAPGPLRRNFTPYLRECWVRIQLTNCRPVYIPITIAAHCILDNARS
jgi:hypothetical protein